MRELNLDKCQYLTQIHDVSNLPNLEIFSFQDCKNLIEIHKSVGFLHKLEILRAGGCIKLMSFPPLKLTSLQELELSYCESLKTFPEILGEMKNIILFILKGTLIEKVPVSFQNLTGLLLLTIKGKGMLRLPSSIFSMPNLSDVIVDGGILQLDDKLSSMVTPIQKHMKLTNCNLSDEFLPIVVMWSANVTTLDLSGNNFTILPECIKDCHFLSKLTLDDCKCLREIRGIPPKLKRLSAIHCRSLTSTARNMLLNQELHESGGTKFCFSGFARIPEWFDHQNMGHTISFWFRNKLPSMALCFSTKLIATIPMRQTDIIFIIHRVIINGNKLDHRYMWGRSYIASTHHTYLYDMTLEFEEVDDMDEWNHAEVICEHREVEPITEIGIHFFKHKNNMDDIQFTNPYEKIKLNDNDDDDGDDVFYDIDDVLDDDNAGVFYDVDDVLDDEDDHHSQ